MSNVTLPRLQTQKQTGDKIVMLTAYEATLARAACNAGVEVLLVGDSLGMVVQGNDSTLPVTVDEMAYHTACVKRGNLGAFLLSDLPFMAAASIDSGLAASAELMRAGAQMVKIEGGLSLIPLIQRLAENGVPVCVHMGLTPQWVNLLGGYKVQGRSAEQAQRLLDEARALEQAGAAMLLLECVPAVLAAQISKAVQIPVIGIGAGAATDGQVLVVHDLLGLTLRSRPPKFVKNFMAGRDSIEAAITAYVQAVKSGAFPSKEHEFSA